jgi:hypothetical protein
VLKKAALELRSGPTSHKVDVQQEHHQPSVACAYNVISGADNHNKTISNKRLYYQDMTYGIALLAITWSRAGKHIID